MRHRAVIAVIAVAVTATCSTGSGTDATRTAPTDAVPAGTTSTSNGSSAASIPTTATTPPLGDIEPLTTARRASDYLAPVSVLYTGEVVTSDPERDLGELTRCVAAAIDPTAPIPPVDADTDPASFDLDLLEPLTAAMDACLRPAVIATRSYLAGAVERDEYWNARCVIDSIGDELSWGDIAGARRAGADASFEIADDAVDLCRELPGADASLTRADEALANALADLADVVGLEFDSDEVRCVLATSSGLVDPDAVPGDAEFDIEWLGPLLDALDSCAPLGGVFAEFDEGAVVYAQCLDRLLAPTIGWREIGELGIRAAELGFERVVNDPVILAVDDARARCLFAEPGEILADLADVIDVEVLTFEGGRLWVGGIDEGGGIRSGNVLLLDVATGSVDTAFDADEFRIDIITAGHDHAWVSSADGESIQRLNAEQGTLDPPVALPGRAVGDLQLGADALWITDNLAGVVLRADPATGEVLDEVPIASAGWYSSDLVMSDGWLWLTNREDTAVRRLDPSTGEIAAEYTLESQYTMHLVDLGDAVGVYGFSQFWRIDADGEAPEELVGQFGLEGLDVDAAIATNGLVAFADEDVSVLAFVDLTSGFVEQTRLIPGSGLIDGGRGHVTSDGSTTWLITYDNLLMRFAT